MKTNCIKNQNRPPRREFSHFHLSQVWRGGSTRKPDAQTDINPCLAVGEPVAPAEVSCPVRYRGLCCHVAFLWVYIIKRNAKSGFFYDVLVAKRPVVTQLWGPYRVIWLRSSVQGTDGKYFTVTMLRLLSAIFMESSSPSSSNQLNSLKKLGSSPVRK